MTSEERAELRAAAEAIVKGVGDTWQAGELADPLRGRWWGVFEPRANLEDRAPDDCDPVPIASVDPHGYMGLGSAPERVARFMALAHPRLVLALLDRIDALTLPDVEPAG